MYNQQQINLIIQQLDNLFTLIQSHEDKIRLLTQSLQITANMGNEVDIIKKQIDNIEQRLSILGGFMETTAGTLQILANQIQTLNAINGITDQ